MQPVVTWSYEDLRVNNVSLKNFGYGVSLVGGLSGVPPRVGSNAEVSGRRGTLFRAKQFTEVKRTLTMWVDSKVPSTGLEPLTKFERLAQRNQNLQDLYTLFGDPARQATFSRDVLLPGRVETWTALGAYGGDSLYVDFGEDEDEYAKFTIDLLFADPLWYGQTSTSGTITAGAGAVVVDNSGELSSVDPTVTITSSGTMVNPTLTNSTNGVSFTLATTLSSGDSIVVECRYPRVRRTSDSANLIGTVSNSGARSFMQLEPGNNSLALTTTSGPGSAVVSFRPPHY
jgi:phage-related protein